MTALAPLPVPAALVGDVLLHLEVQILSARRLLGSILRQGEAIKDHDVEAVLARLTEMQTEMSLRARLEEERTALLVEAGGRLGVSAAGVTLDGLTRLMGPAEAETARTRSAELRGLLDEITREHGINRALMRQELSFLDHLVRLIGQEPERGYRPPAGPGEGRSAYPVLDLQA